MSKRCQKVIKNCFLKLSKSYQKVVKKLSNKCQKSCRSCQKIINKLSKKCPKICQKLCNFFFVKKLSKMFVKNLSIICPFAQIVREEGEEEEEDWWLLDQVATSSHLVKTLNTGIKPSGHHK
jgi:hypothetical protein